MKWLRACLSMSCYWNSWCILRPSEQPTFMSTHTTTLDMLHTMSISVLLQYPASSLSPDIVTADITAHIIITPHRQLREISPSTTFSTEGHHISLSYDQLWAASLIGQNAGTWRWALSYVTLLQQSIWLPPIRFSQAGGQSAHKARPPQPRTRVDATAAYNAGSAKKCANVVSSIYTVRAPCFKRALRMFPTALKPAQNCTGLTRLMALFQDYLDKPLPER